MALPGICRYTKMSQPQGNKTVDSVDENSLMEGADESLLMAVDRNAGHALRPRFPPVILRHYNLRPRSHNFCLPVKDDSNFIPRVVHRFSRTIQQSERLSFPIVLYHVVVCHHDLIKRRYIHIQLYIHTPVTHYSQNQDGQLVLSCVSLSCIYVYAMHVFVMQLRRLGHTTVIVVLLFVWG